MTKERKVLPDTVVPWKYAIDISTNMKDDFKFRGHVDIHLTLKEDTSEIMMYTKQLELDGCIFVDAEGGEHVTKNLSYDKKDEIMTFTFPTPLKAGDGVMSIDYIGLHNTEMAGFYRSGYPGKDGERKVMVSTQFEALDARRCFPCVDEPAVKATFICSLVVDDGLVALSNMPVESNELIETGPDKGRRKFKYQETPKMSTYLLAFVVGEFDYVEKKTEHNVLLRVYTPLNKTELGTFALEVGAKSLDLYDGMFGKPFPLPKMDMIAIPEFAAGAMENWGLVTYREVDLLIDGEKASSQQKQRVAIVVTHELAHQWFGNLVTMDWWDDLWLNEGFASWMQNYTADLIFPEWKMWEQFICNEQAQALGLDSLATSHPIQVPIYRAQEVEEVFDLISYNKGSCVVRLVNAYLGKKDFFKGLQDYMDKHQYGNTQTHDLWSAWEKASGKPINKIMASWTEQMGFPLITVKKAETKDGVSKLVLSQKWFLGDGSDPDVKIPKEKGKRWSIPMFGQTQEGQLELDLFTDAEAEFDVKVGKSGWLKLNAGQKVPLRVNYLPEQWEALADAIAAGQLSVEDRIGVLEDAYALLKAGFLSPAIILKIIRGLKGEKKYPVWDALSGILASLHKVVESEKELQAKFGDIAKGLILPAFNSVGWESKATDTHLNKMLRGTLIGLLDRFASDDKEILAHSRKLFEAYIKDPKTKLLPADYKSSVFITVLKNSEGADEFNELFNSLNKLETNVERNAVYLSLGSTKDPALRKRVLDWAISGEVKLQDFFYPILSVSMTGTEGTQLAWDHFKANFDKISDMLKTANPALMGAVIAYSTYTFDSEDKAAEIEEYFKTHDSRNERKVQQIVERIRNAAKFKALMLDSGEFKAALA